MEKNTQRMSDKEMNNAGMKRPTCASIGSNDCQCCNRRNSHSLTNGSVLKSKVGWGPYVLGCKCSICSLYICSARKNVGTSRIIRSKEIKYKHHLVLYLDLNCVIYGLGLPSTPVKPVYRAHQYSMTPH